MYANMYVVQLLDWSLSLADIAPKRCGDESLKWQLDETSKFKSSY